jgi:hypothetical protein
MVIPKYFPNNAEPPELGHNPATPFENQGDYDVPDN